MKKLIPFLKVLFLTIITFGVYGAYWIMKNISKDTSPAASEEEKKANEFHNDATAASMFFLNPK